MPTQPARSFPAEQCQTSGHRSCSVTTSRTLRNTATRTGSVTMALAPSVASVAARPSAQADRMATGSPSESSARMPAPCPESSGMGTGTWSMPSAVRSDPSAARSWSVRRSTTVRMPRATSRARSASVARARCPERHRRPCVVVRPSAAGSPPIPRKLWIRSMAGNVAGLAEVPEVAEMPEVCAESGMSAWCHVPVRPDLSGGRTIWRCQTPGQTITRCSSSTTPGRG